MSLLALTAALMAAHGAHAGMVRMDDPSVPTTSGASSSAAGTPATGSIADLLPASDVISFGQLRPGRSEPMADETRDLLRASQRTFLSMPRVPMGMRAEDAARLACQALERDSVQPDAECFATSRRDVQDRRGALVALQPRAFRRVALALDDAVSSVMRHRPLGDTALLPLRSLFLGGLVELLDDVVDGPLIAVETGFLVGKAAARLLISSPRLVLHSFELDMVPHTQAAERVLQHEFPGRFHLHFGDSAPNILSWFAGAGAAAQSEAQDTFGATTMNGIAVGPSEVAPRGNVSLVFVDGDHSDRGTWRDLLAGSLCVDLQAPHFVTLDDATMPPVRAAWDRAVSVGLVTHELSIRPTPWTSMPAVLQFGDMGREMQRVEYADQFAGMYLRRATAAEMRDAGLA